MGYGVVEGSGISSHNNGKSVMEKWKLYGNGCYINIQVYGLPSAVIISF